MLGLLCSRRSSSLGVNLRKRPFTELPESMSSSVSPRVDLAWLTTEATASSTEKETRQCVEQAYRGSTSFCFPPWNYSTRNIRCRHCQRLITSDHPAPRESRKRRSPPPNAAGNGTEIVACFPPRYKKRTRDVMLGTVSYVLLEKPLNMGIRCGACYHRGSTLSLKYFRVTGPLTLNRQKQPTCL